MRINRLSTSLALIGALAVILMLAQQVRPTFKSDARITTNAPTQFSIQWNNVPKGDYNITAVATDNRGAQTVSSPVRITICQKNRLKNGDCR